MTPSQKRFADNLQIKSFAAECELSINKRSVLYARDTITKMARHAASIGQYFLSVVLINVQHDLPTFELELCKALFDKGFPIASAKRVNNTKDRIRVHVAWYVHL